MFDALNHCATAHTPNETLTVQESLGEKIQEHARINGNNNTLTAQVKLLRENEDNLRNLLVERERKQLMRPKQNYRRSNTQPPPTFQSIYKA